MPNKIIPYNPELKAYARALRKNPTKTERILWQQIRSRALGVQFHRQVPMRHFIVDFYCHEIGLAIEVDGGSHRNKFLYDARRQGILEKEGVFFLRFSNKQVLLDLSSVLHSIQTVVHERVIEQGVDTSLDPSSRREVTPPSVPPKGGKHKPVP